MYAKDYFVRYNINELSNNNLLSAYVISYLHIFPERLVLT